MELFLTVAGSMVLVLVFWRKLSWGVYALVAALPFERIGSWALNPDTGHPVVRLSQIIAAALIVAFALNAVLGKVRLRRPSALLWVLAAFDVSTGISAFRLGYLTLINGWVALIFMSLLVYVLYSLVLEGLISWRRLLLVLLGSAVAVSIFGLYQFVAGSLGVSETFTGLRPTYGRQTFGFPRIQSTALEPLYFANYLLIPLLVGGAALLATRFRQRKLGIAVGLVGLAFVLTMSRGAFIGLGAGLASGLLWVLTSSTARRRLRSVSRYLALGFAGIVVAGLLLLGVASAISRGSFSQGPKQFLSLVTTELTTTSSFTERAQMRETAIKIFRANPLLGVGIEGITPYLNGYDVARTPDDIVALNNQFYEALAETGLIGASLFYLFLIGILLSAMWVWRRTEGLAQAWLVGLALAVVAMTVQAQSFSGFLLTHLWTSYGLLAGLAAVSAARKRRAEGPSHIVIDARMYGPQRWTGIGRYLQNLIAELEQLDHESQYTILLDTDNFDEYTPAAANFRKVLAPFPIYGMAEQWGLWRLLRTLKPDLVHFPAPNAPVLWRGARVTTIHDLTLLDYSTSRYTGLKELVSFAKRLVFRVVMRVSISQSTHILTPTVYVKQQLIKRYGVRPSQVTAAPLSVSESMDHPADISRYKLGHSYLAYVGNCYPYKNVGLILQALQLLHDAQPELKLAVVGREDHFRGLLHQQAAEMGLSEQVIFTGQVTDGELAGIYRHATLYVYPSLSEGFGLQGLEAMSHGVPVLAARATCLPETCGEAAVYFDPYDAPALAKLIEQFLDDSARRDELKKVGTAWVQTFSWKRTAQQTLVAYQETLRG